MIFRKNLRCVTKNIYLWRYIMARVLVNLSNYSALILLWYPITRITPKTKKRIDRKLIFSNMPHTEFQASSFKLLEEKARNTTEYFLKKIDGFSLLPSSCCLSPWCFRLSRLQFHINWTISVSNVFCRVLPYMHKKKRLGPDSSSGFQLSLSLLDTKIG